MKTFEIISGKMVCSDPCYEFSTWCQGVIDSVKNGTWVAKTTMVDNRIASLSVSHSTASGLESGDVLPFDFGVDSGQFGFFDHISYRNDESAKDLPKYVFGDDDKDEWYRACCYLTLDEKQWGVLPHGAVASSGYGDGSYKVVGAKNSDGEYVAFTIIFIEERGGWF